MNYLVECVQFILTLASAAGLTGIELVMILILVILSLAGLAIAAHASRTAPDWSSPEAKARSGRYADSYHGTTWRKYGR